MEGPSADHSDDQVKAAITEAIDQAESYFVFCVNADGTTARFKNFVYPAHILAGIGCADAMRQDLLDMEKATREHTDY
jgi:hypothetical protein